MRGSIRKRGSTYSYWLDIGSDPVTGKRRQRTKGGFRTKRECQAALNEAISALRSGTLVQPSRRTVASFLVEEWLPAVRMAGLRDSTWASYRMNVEKHLVPGLGAIELQRLSPAQLNAFYRVLLTRAAAKRPAAWHPRRCATSIRSCIGRCGMRCAGAMSCGTWRMLLTRRRLRHPRCACGHRRSSAPSWSTSATIGCTRRGYWPRRPGCAGARSSGCAGATWIWTPAGSRCGGPEFWWTTRYRCRSRRRPRVAARSPWTR